jgi:hypothetical protein
VRLRTADQDRGCWYEKQLQPSRLDMCASAESTWHAPIVVIVGGGGTRRHIGSQQQWHWLPTEGPTVRNCLFSACLNTGPAVWPLLCECCLNVLGCCRA